MSRSSLVKIFLLFILFFSIAPAWATERVVVADFSSGVEKTGYRWAGNSRRNQVRQTLPL